MITQKTICDSIWAEWRVANTKDLGWNTLYCMLDGMIALTLYSLERKEYKPLIDDIRCLKAICVIRGKDAI